MKGHVFNIDNGYLEGLCRGFKNGILRQADYLNLVQCETLEGKTYKMTVSSF
jgi:V-type H+-transporting ATPase subunit d